MSKKKQEGVRVVKGKDPKKDPGPGMARIQHKGPEKSKAQSKGGERSQRPGVRLKKKFPGRPKPDQKRRPKPGRDEKPDQLKKTTRPGASKDGGKKKKVTREIPDELKVKPEDLKIPAGMLLVSFSGWIAEKRDDIRCLATKKEEEDFEKLFNAWIDFRLPVLIKFAPDIAVLVPLVCYMRRISTLPQKKAKAHDTTKDSE